MADMFSLYSQLVSANVYINTAAHQASHLESTLTPVGSIQLLLPNSTRSEISDCFALSKVDGRFVQSPYKIFSLLQKFFGVT